MQSMHHEMPTVWLIGETEHPELVESVSLVRGTARVKCVADARQAAALLGAAPAAPELFVVAASRPGIVRDADMLRLRRAAPLAGVVALLGSWCEGEPRSGRPAAGVGRVYWYDFSGWWRRQLAARTEGRCPEWALPEDCGLRIADCGFRRAVSSPTPTGLVVLDTTCWESADALAEVLRPAGYCTAWGNFGRRGSRLRGVAAGVWEGRQLDDREFEHLTTFCSRLADDAASVIALLDFPRRDRAERAREAGAAVVLGKPWLNADLLATLQLAIDKHETTADSQVARAA